MIFFSVPVPGDVYCPFCGVSPCAHLIEEC